MKRLLSVEERYQIKCDAEEWCKVHNLPISMLKETEEGFIFTKTFKYV